MTSIEARTPIWEANGICSTCLTCLSASHEVRTSPYCLQHSRPTAEVLSALNRGDCYLCIHMFLPIEDWLRARSGSVYDPGANAIDDESCVETEYHWQQRLCSNSPHIQPREKGWIYIRSLTFATDPGFRLYFYLGGEAITLGHANDSIRLLESDLDADRDRLSGNLDSYTGSEGSMDTALQGIQNCVESHITCNIAKGPHSYPTRLLEIACQSPRDDRVRLVRTLSWKNVSERYNTLSHAWGKGGFLQLNSTTMPLLEAGVETDKLPQTFKDAIQVCKKMGISYIWIDSLCIQQDDLHDWNRESRQMAKVYSFAYCNISATCCTSSDQSLFRHRGTGIADPWVKIALPASSGLLTQHRFRVNADSYYTRKLYDAPLHRRAWVLQERLLAKRVLHFMEDELIWECQTLIASEAWTKGLPFYYRQPPLHLKSLEFDGFDLRRKWQEVQKIYSRSYLTFRDDRTMAILGIAAVFQKMLDAGYLVGMWWNETLPLDLLWRVEYKPAIERSVIQGESVVPTFSWLSLEVGVLTVPDELQADHHIEILHAGMPSAYEDLPTPIQSTQLFIRGHLRAVILESDGNTDVTSRSSWKIRMAGDEDSLLSLVIWPDWTRLDLPVDSTHRRHFILPVFTYQDSTDWEGLILEQPLQDSTHLRRIGTLGNYEPGSSANYFSICKSQSGVEEFPCEAYDATTGRHTICLI